MKNEKYLEKIEAHTKEIIEIARIVGGYAEDALVSHATEIRLALRHLQEASRVSKRQLEQATGNSVQAD